MKGRGGICVSVRVERPVRHRTHNKNWKTYKTLIFIRLLPRSRKFAYRFASEKTSSLKFIECLWSGWSCFTIELFGGRGGSEWKIEKKIGKSRFPPYVVVKKAVSRERIFAGINLCSANSKQWREVMPWRTKTCSLVTHN